MGKFYQSSIPSLPYTLCIKLTWNSLSLFWKCCHQLPKKGRLKASRPLIRVLVINDNICGLTISWENLYVRLIHENVCMSWCHERNWRWYGWFRSRQRYMLGLFYFAGHEEISGWNMTGLIGYIAVLSRGVVVPMLVCSIVPFCSNTSCMH